METLGQPGSLPEVSRRPQTDDLNFDRFAARAEYRDEGLGILVEALPYLPQNEIFYHVDIGTGNGLAPQLMSSLVDASLRKAVIFGIDPDERALDRARKSTPTTDRCRSIFIKGLAQDTKELLKDQIPYPGAHIVTILDAIHEFPQDEQEPSITAVAQILRPGGIFVMNSAFTSIAQEEKDMRIWGRPPVIAAHRLGGVRNREVKGLLRRQPEEYIGMIERSGLEVVYERRNWVTLYSEALMAICFYPGFSKGAFMGYTFPSEVTEQQKSEVLAEEFGKNPFLRRQWWRVIAQKPDLAA